MSPEHDRPIVDLSSYDWSHPAATKLHQALTVAYGTKWAAIQRRVASAGVDWTRIYGESMSAEDLWHQVLEGAARKGVTRRLIDGVIKDPDVENHAQAIAKLALSAPGNALRNWPRERSPFPGLSAFTKDYAPVFCGRDAEVRALVDEIRAMRERRFLAVIGASGCGKSSIVRAGLLPMLEDEGWLTVTCRPAECRKDPFLSLAFGLRELLQSRGQAADMDSLERELRQDLPGLLKQLNKARPGALHPAGLLLFVDQLEELFTQVLPAPDSGEQRALAFLALLERAADTPGLCVVVTMRDDMMAAYLNHRPLVDLMQRRQILVYPTGPLALLEMIEPPAAMAAGLKVDAALREQLFTDFGRATAGLPLLAFVLSELYKRADERGHLTLAAYEAMGRLDGALNTRAEAALEALQRGRSARLEPEQLNRLFTGVFGKLVGVTGQGLASRERRALAELPEGEDSHALVEAMVEARLLVISGDAESPGAAASNKAALSMVELAHERLLDAWDKLSAMVDERRDQYLLLRRLKEDAREWRPYRKQQAKSDELLWKHERQAMVPAMREQLQPHLTVTERAFVIPEWVRLVKRLEDIDIPHRERLRIGDRLAAIGGERGDPRLGVGLDARGLPDVLAAGYWCEIKPGSVTLESNLGQHTIKDRFCIGRYPVTWIQYQAFLGDKENGHASTRWWADLDRHDPVEYPSHYVMNRPAVDVSWYDAMAFCRWLSWKLDFEECELRLPTEVQWQLAACGGRASREFPWGSDWDSRLANTGEAKLSATSAVGMYPAGAAACGALDLAGNTWEWCLNEYDAPDRMTLAGDAARVVRGGSWSSGHHYARTADRGKALPLYRNFHRGFRMVVSSPIPALEARLPIGTAPRPHLPRHISHLGAPSTGDERCSR